MLKLVIADDEWFIRESLHHGIDWESLNIHVVGVAANGMDALEMIKKEEPHMLVTDIRMPGINGLDLIKLAKEMVPHLRTIIISGFGEFEYAQKALKMGANDYILKPIEENELIKIMQGLATELEQEKKHLILQYLKTADENEDFAQQSERLSRIVKGKWAIICWECDQFIELPTEPGVNVIHQKENEGILFIEEAEKKENFLQEITKFFSQNDVIGGYSGLSDHLKELPNLYRQAMRIKNQHQMNHSPGGLYSEQSSPINMEQVLQYIHDHYKESISLHKIASSYYISDSYFSRIFKQYTGKNFVEYLTDYRMKVACELLAYTSMKANEVSSAVGYTDQRYFSQIFKKSMGLTPSAYKKKMQE